MTKKEISKLATLVKTSTQKEAVYSILEQGFEPSVGDLRAAGIADPYRVVNRLRNENGMPIYLNDRRDRSGQSIRRFRLGTPRRSA
jgi:hypothetical protein